MPSHCHSHRENGSVFMASLDQLSFTSRTFTHDVTFLQPIKEERFIQQMSQAKKEMNPARQRKVYKIGGGSKSSIIKFIITFKS